MSRVRTPLPAPNSLIAEILRREPRRAPQANPRREPREPDLREEPVVDEEDRDLEAVALGKHGVGIDVHDLPDAILSRQNRLHLLAHAIAEVTAGPREQAEANHAGGFGSSAELDAT